MPLLDTFKSFIQSPTESKVKQATNEDETSGATGTLMNEISILTYSPKTVREIIQVIRKRLLLGQNRRNSHRNCIQVMKTLTLVSYLMNNGSNEFIKWLKGNMILIEILEDFQVQDPRDERSCLAFEYLPPYVHPEDPEPENPPGSQLVSCFLSAT